jgi:phenylacetyl-CoA:acceptor oxidoreductase
MSTAHDIRRIPTYCYQCVAGPDLMTVKVEDGVATEVGPNAKAAGIHPADGRPCVRAYGLIQKTYNPHRVLTPMKRSNPKKGRDQDPGFVPISWDEALDAIAAKLTDIRARGLLDEQGLPRVAATFGHGGTPASYMGSFPAFLAAWGPIDYSLGSGQGVKCVHSEHLYGEFWHRGFTVCADTPHTRYVLSFGANVEVSGGACAVRRHADARVRGVRRVNIEPHLSVTGACSAEWVPIRPKTDAAFMFALLHVLLCEVAPERLDQAFLRDRSASPYLVGPDGYYLRDPASGKPLLWDTRTKHAVPHDTPGAVPALNGHHVVEHAVSHRADGEVAEHHDVMGRTALDETIASLQGNTPEWAAAICDVPAATIRRVALEYLDAACVGETVEIDGRTLPFRPVAVTLGKTVNNGWGAYECCWARTMLALVVGALEVPGGTLGSTVRLNKPHDNRLLSVTAGDDGFMTCNFNPTGEKTWAAKPTGRNAHRTLVPHVGNSPWSQALGPTHLAWLFMREAPPRWQQPTLPELWFAYRTNPAISFWGNERQVETIAKLPFIVAFAYTMDETNHMADILLPEATDLESTQLIRCGGTKFVEQAWAYRGVVLRQPAVQPRGESRDFSWIATELARRSGLLAEYVDRINRGNALVPLKTAGHDFSLPTDRAPDVPEIWDAVCKAATAELSGGAEVHGLDWMKRQGFYVVPHTRLDWYLTPTMEDLGLRYELPYQERLLRIGEELRRRLHGQGIDWWDRQLAEYTALPAWHDFPGLWKQAVRAVGEDPDDYPFWGLTTKVMAYSAGANVGIPLMDEVGANVRGHGRVVMNAGAAGRLGIVQDDWVEVQSTTGRTRGRAELVQGCRPDTLVIPGQFEHWKTPYAKDLQYPSLNAVTPMSRETLDLTDATGSGADIVRVRVRRVDGPIGGPISGPIIRPIGMPQAAAGSTP